MSVLRIAIVGNSQAGKTGFVNALTHKPFPKVHRHTSGWSETMLLIGDREVCIVEFGGGEQYNKDTKPYPCLVHHIIVMYNGSSKLSYRGALEMMREYDSSTTTLVRNFDDIASPLYNDDRALACSNQRVKSCVNVMNEVLKSIE